MARPKRTRRLHAMLSEEEYGHLAYMAYDDGMTLSDKIRQLIREQVAREDRRKIDEQAIADLRRAIDAAVHPKR